MNSGRDIAADRVSWLIPVRNDARRLGDAVRSALDDSFVDDEVIVIDDGSSDDPSAHLPVDPRVRFVRQEPSGIVAALERGRAAARHPLIARLDADDISLPGRLDAQRAALKADEALAVVGGRVEIVVDHGEIPQGMRTFVDWINSLDDPAREILVESPLVHPAVMIRKSALDAVGGWRDGDFPEDYDLWLRLAAAGFGIASVPTKVMLWRDRADRLTRTDPRYRRDAFDRLKWDFLERRILPERQRIALWCGRLGSKPWLERLIALGKDVTVVDIGRAKVRLGRPVVPPESLAALDIDLLLVSVGSRGARDEIRRYLAQRLPNLVEGRHWWALR